MSIVSIRNAHKYYNRGKGNEIHVMDNISLELPEAGMIAIFGKSGCGKTTLLNAIGGLDRIQMGSIELFGRNIREDTDTVRNRYIGYIFQNYNLNVADTVYENVAAALRLCGMTDEAAIAERVMATLCNVGMDKYRDRTPDTLSGGQQQRVAIARALVKDPAIILADEPTGNLDEANTVMVMDILREISKSHLVLLVTHEADLVDYYCDRVIEIVDGRIAGERINHDPRGYVRRDKNDIYLGELACIETAAPGVKLAYYGEPMGELTLRVVHIGGKLYLKAEGMDVKLLDESSEIRLREGIFEATPTEDGAGQGQHAASGGRTWDMSRLPPVTGEHYGRLYHLKNAFAAGWRENFSRKHKRGKGLLRACLFMLAVVMVFMTATTGAGIRSFADMLDIHNETLYYVPVVPGTDYTALNEGIGDHGIVYTRLIGSSPIFDYESLVFRSSVFVTGQSTEMSVEARAQDVVHAQALPVAAGVVTLAEEHEIVITTAVADKLIQTSTVNYINEYRDLVGLLSAWSYNNVGDRHMRIVGVVESDEMVYYMDSDRLVWSVLRNYFAAPITSASQAGMEDRIRPGEFIYVDDGTLQGEPVVGGDYRFMGQELTLAEVITSEISVEAFTDHLEATTGEAPRDFVVEGDVDYAVILSDWVPQLTAFVQSRINMRPAYLHVDLIEWAIGMESHLGQIGLFLGVEADRLCAAALYQAENGVYPTAEELEEYCPKVEAQVASMLDDTLLYEAYEQYIRDRKYAYDDRSSACYILHDDDYRRLITNIGTTSEELGMYTYDYDDGYYNYHSNHLQIKTADSATTEAFLRETVGEGNYLTPDDVLEEQMLDIRISVLLCAVSILVILALMCLCVYFIMRASFMSRVREVGILRAIGVTRRNLIFRFAVETCVLVGLTLLPGYLLSSYFIASLSGAALFSTLFYFPVWLGGGLLAIICGVALLFGMLPAVVLLRRTPSEILAKYDI